MLISIPRFRAALRLALAWVAVAWMGVCQAASVPEVAWADRGDAVFRPGIGAWMIALSFAQDRQGFLWVATQTGLARWDGYKLRTFLGDLTTPGALPGSYVRALHVDAAGRLWVVTLSGGIARYDEASERFEVPVPASALSEPYVRRIAEDRDGTLLLGTGAGLDRFDPARRVVQRHADWAAALGLPAMTVRTVLVDRTGRLWVGGERGLYRREGNGRFVPVPLAALAAADSDINCLLEDSDGRVWAGTQEHGAFFVEPGAAMAQALHRRIRLGEPGMATAVVFAAEEARPGEVWLGTMGQGILRVDTRRWQVRAVRHVDNVAASLPVNHVSALFRDRQGLMWVATEQGVSLHDPQQAGIVTWFGGQRGGLASSAVHFVLAMPDGTAWLSTDQGGIDIVSPQSGRVRHLRPDSRRPWSALPEQRVGAMVASADGRQVYAGTISGLYRIDARTLRVQRLVPAGRAPTAEVIAMAVLGDRLWVGGQEGLWGARLPPPGPWGPEGQDMVLPVAPRESAPALGLGRIDMLRADRDGRLWVGCATGLAYLEPATRRVHRYPPDAPGRIGMPTSIVSAVQTDAQGRVWAAGYGAGIRVFEPSPEGPKNLRRISVADGLPTGAVNALAIDGRGNVWASTDEGLARIDHDTLQVQAVGRNQGLGIQAYWTGAAAVTPRGHLLFGGVGGLTVIDPERISTGRTAPPRVVVTEVRLGDAPPVTAYRGDAPLQLKPGARSLLVEFAGLHFEAPAAVRYQYRMADTDAHWIDTDAGRRFASYTNLPPGDHVLELRAAAPNGAWSEPLRLPVHVEPAWYEAAPFRAAMGVVVLLLLWALVRLRTRLLLRRALLLSEQVAQRTRELQQRTEQLEASRQALRELGAHNVRALEEERKRVARELHDELGQQMAAMRMEMSVLKARTEAGQAPEAAHWVQLRERVDRLTASMRRLVSDLRPPALDGGLTAALQWLAAEYGRAAGIDCEVEVDAGERSLTPEAQTMIFRVAQESLNNVLRHARASRASLQLRRSPDGWHLRVTDDGIGFDTATPARGFGLLGMDERTQLLGGTLRIDSRPGAGTCVHLHLPADASP